MKVRDEYFLLWLMVAWMFSLCGIVAWAFFWL